MVQEKEQKKIKAKRKRKWKESVFYLLLTLFALSLLLLGHYLTNGNNPWLALLGCICLLIGAVILLVLYKDPFHFLDTF